MRREWNAEEKLRFEREMLAAHARYIAGVDEVGRGPLAGPVVCAAVILPLEDAALIEGGQVNLNFFEQTKISKEVAQGDILSIRGYGRFVLVQIGDKSKKGRLHLTVGQYV